jgi:hypothetical protein
MVRKKIAYPVFGVISRTERISSADKTGMSAMPWKVQFEGRVSLCLGANLIKNCGWEKGIIGRA